MKFMPLCIQEVEDDVLLCNLNKAQLTAVTSLCDTVAILAGPGCGKTHTLTSRVAFLIDRLGYQPQNIIVATFTVKAAREMRERIGKIVGEERQKRLVLGTFHGLAARYLGIYGHLIGLPKKFGIMDDADQRAVLKRILKKLGLEDDDFINPKSAQGWISRKKSQSPHLDPEDELPAGTRSTVNASGFTIKPKLKNNSHSKNYQRIFEEYEDHLRKADMLDYDDLLIRCVQLLTENPRCVSNVEAVLIDEYQDTNGMQYELLKCFAQARNRITIVGDPDQSIYGWRAAEIRNLRRLLKEFPGTYEVALEENYRSSMKIIDSAVQVIRQDADRYDKSLVPVHGRGTQPTLRHLGSGGMQAEWIASEIQRIVAMTARMLRYDDMVILLRAASASRLIEEKLVESRIKYRVVGGLRFYDRVEIKLLLDYLRVMNNCKHNDVVMRIVNTPKRGIGNTTLRALFTNSEEQGISLWDNILEHVRGNAKVIQLNQKQQQELSKLVGLIKGGQTRLRLGAEGKPFDLVKLMEYIIRTVDLKAHLIATFKKEAESRIANIDELVKTAVDFMANYKVDEQEDLPEIEGIEQKIHMDMLDRFLTNISLTNEKQETVAEDEELGMVTISTIHAAKGLEWPVVFVPNVYQGSIPNSRVDDIAEERRLLYVAMTRAKVLLYLSHPARERGFDGKWSDTQLSVFVTDLEKMFAKRGPSFSRDTLASLGSILERKFPTVDQVYKLLPDMAITEDDLFPEKPRVPKDDDDGEFPRMRQMGDEYDDDDSHRDKRARVLKSGARAESAAGWNAGYSTTMEQASTFSIGFVSASSLPQQTNALNSKFGVKRSVTSHETTMGRAGTLVAHRFANKAITAYTVRRSGFMPSTPSLPPLKKEEENKSDVSPSLTKHSVGPVTGAIRTKVEESPGKFAKISYPQFSSSPTRPSPYKSFMLPPAHIPSQPAVNKPFNPNSLPGRGNPGFSTLQKDSLAVKASRQLSSNDGGNDDCQIVDQRPAQTLHQTTIEGTMGSFQRMGTVSRFSGPQTINRLSRLGRPPAGTGQKPYKLTVNREMRK